MNRRIPELDGVRGIAILLIILVHFGDYTEPPTRSFFEHLVRAVMGLGWTGVDLFFVLSGFLITAILLEAKGSANYFRSFYARRALRILPLYYGSVAAFFWIILPLAHASNHALQFQSSEQSWFWLYISNWRIAFDEYAVEPLSHFWSLAIEEQFYLVWPVVVLVISEATLRYVCAGVILLSLILRCLPSMQALHSQYSEFLYCLTPFRIDALAFGALVALITRSRSLRITALRWLPLAFLAGVAGVIAAAAVARSVRPFSAAMGSFGYSAVGLAYASIVLFAVSRSDSPSALPRLLRHPALRSLGKYSYAMYVVHWPISLYMTGYFQDRFRSSLGSLGAALLCIAAGLALSYSLARVSWNVLERHFLKLRSRFPYKYPSPAAPEGPVSA